MPQGDLHFFSYDVTTLVGAFGLGYFVFVGVLAPRLVATLEGRAWLTGAVHLRQAPLGCHPPRVGAVNLLAVAGGVVATSETFLALVQFSLLALVVYQVGSNRLGVTHTKLTPTPAPAGRAPTFGVYTQVGTNLIQLWGHHRGDLFFQPAAAALLGVTQQVLERLTGVVPPGVLPRLTGVVKDSARGLHV